MHNSEITTTNKAITRKEHYNSLQNGSVERFFLYFDKWVGYDEKTQLRGFPVALINGYDLLDERKQLAHFLQYMTIAFQEPYSQKGHEKNLFGIHLFQIAVEKLWTDKELINRVKEFELDQKYHKFTVAQFFDGERPKLYPESWFKTKIKEDANNITNIEIFEAFDSSGVIYKLYRFVDPQNPVKHLTKYQPKKLVAAEMPQPEGFKTIEQRINEDALTDKEKEMLNSVDSDGVNFLATISELRGKYK